MKDISGRIRYPEDDYNPSEWIKKYDDLTWELSKRSKKFSWKGVFKQFFNEDSKNSSISRYSIIPKYRDGRYSKDPDNVIYVTREERIRLLYYLWEFDYHYAYVLKFWIDDFGVGNIPEEIKNSYDRISRSASRILSEAKVRGESYKYLLEIKSKLLQQGFDVHIISFYDNRVMAECFKKYIPETNTETTEGEWNKGRDIWLTLDIDVTNQQEEWPDDSYDPCFMYSGCVRVNSKFGSFDFLDADRLDLILDPEYRRELYAKTMKTK